MSRTHDYFLDGARAEAQGCYRPEPVDYDPEPACPRCNTLLAAGDRMCHKCGMTAEEWEEEGGCV